MDSLTTAALKLYWCIWLLRLFEVKASEWKSCHYNSTTVSSYQFFYLFIYLFIYYCYYSARCFYRLEIGWVLLIELEDGLEQLSEDFEVVQEGFFEILVGMLFYWSTGRSSRSNVPLRRRWDADGTPMLSWSSRLAHYYYFHITCWFSFVCLTVEPPPLLLLLLLLFLLPLYLWPRWPWWHLIEIRVPFGEHFIHDGVDGLPSFSSFGFFLRDAPRSLGRTNVFSPASMKPSRWIHGQRFIKALFERLKQLIDEEDDWNGATGARTSARDSRPFSLSLRPIFLVWK